MFDPFEHRISRDIRNELASHFLDLMTEGNRQKFDEKTAALKKRAPDTDHILFIDERLVGYQKVFQEGKGSGPFDIALLLWNHRLFFECHEWLEPLWLDAEGTIKKAIQGIIRTAGAHVLDEAGRQSGSQSSARKALILIQTHRADIPPQFNPEDLISSLEKLIG